jgi:hypothetical protein
MPSEAVRTPEVWTTILPVEAFGFCSLNRISPEMAVEVPRMGSRGDSMVKLSPLTP